MRVLLDENLDWRLRRDLLEHDVESVPLIGWQNIGGYTIAVIALRARSNRLADTRPLMPALLSLLPRLQRATVTFLPSSE
jgi:hypothetical protein